MIHCSGLFRMSQLSQTRHNLNVQTYFLFITRFEYQWIFEINNTIWKLNTQENSEMNERLLVEYVFRYFLCEVTVIKESSSNTQDQCLRSSLLRTTSKGVLGLIYRPPSDQRMGEGNSFSLFTFRGGGVPDPALDGGGGPRSQIFRGGPRSQIFGGVPRSQIFLGGVPGLRFLGGGIPSLSKGKNFWHQIWLDTCSDWGKNFCRGTPPLVKGKLFDTRFGLIHAQTGKKNFCWGTPPLVKGKNFDTRFGLIHVQTGKKIFVKGPPPLVKGKIFDIRFGLIHVQTGKKFFVKGPPPPGIARNCYCYAAGGMPLAFTQEDFLVLPQSLYWKQWQQHQHKQQQQQQQQQQQLLYQRQAQHQLQQWNDHQQDQNLQQYRLKWWHQLSNLQQHQQQPRSLQQQWHPPSLQQQQQQPRSLQQQSQQRKSCQPQHNLALQLRNLQEQLSMPLLNLDLQQRQNSRTQEKCNVSINIQWRTQDGDHNRFFGKWGTRPCLTCGSPNHRGIIWFTTEKQ